MINFVLPSTQEMYKTMKYMGSKHVRIDTPMLHPDHIRTAAVLFRQLADDLEQLAGAKGTNFNKIFSARVSFSVMQERLKKRAAYDM